MNNWTLHSQIELGNGLASAPAIRERFFQRKPHIKASTIQVRISPYAHRKVFTNEHDEPREPRRGRRRRAESHPNGEERIRDRRRCSVCTRSMVSQ